MLLLGQLNSSFSCANKKKLLHAKMRTLKRGTKEKEGMEAGNIEWRGEKERKDLARKEKFCMTNLGGEDESESLDLRTIVSLVNHKVEMEMKLIWNKNTKKGTICIERDESQFGVVVEGARLGFRRYNF